jgi:hypothetical protein
MPLVVAGAGWLRFLACCLLLSVATVPALAQLDPQSRKLSRDIFQQLIEINTTDSVGSTTVAAKAMAQRLLDAGFAKEDVLVLGPNDRKGNLVVRFHGTGRAKPSLFNGHLDVVEALRSDWTTDPFQGAASRGGHCAFVPDPRVQRHHAHHVCRHAPFGRRCQQRPAEDCASQRQLPDSPRAFAGRALSCEIG